MSKFTQEEALKIARKVSAVVSVTSNNYPLAFQVTTEQLTVALNEAGAMALETAHLKAHNAKRIGHLAVFELEALAAEYRSAKP